jgi:hypothetical protein
LLRGELFPLYGDDGVFLGDEGRQLDGATFEHFDSRHKIAARRTSVIHAQ